MSSLTDYGGPCCNSFISFWDYHASNEKNKLLEKIEHNKREIRATTKLYDQNPGKMTPLRPRSQASVSSNIAFFSSLYFFYNKSLAPAILNVPFMNGHFPSWYHKSPSCLRRTRVFPRTVKERFCQQEKDDTSKTLKKSFRGTLFGILPNKFIKCLSIWSPLGLTGSHTCTCQGRAVGSHCLI